MSPPRRYVAVFWVLWTVIVALTGGAKLFTANFAIAGGIGTVALPIVGYLWCKADSAARNVRVPPGAIPLMAVLLPIGWAYYLFATRGPIRGTAAILGAVVVAFGIALIVMLLKTGGHVAT